jgi:hypothetical protein
MKRIGKFQRLFLSHYFFIFYPIKVTQNESSILLSILFVGFGTFFALNVNVYFSQKKEIKKLKEELDNERKRNRQDTERCLSN